MLVAPTELRHAPFRALTRADRGSNKPETMGVDFAFNYRGLWWGIQRKEIKDFIASVNDGRLAKEVKQMTALEQGVVVIEGQPKWSLDGHLLGDSYGSSWDRQRHCSMLLSLQEAGVWVMGSIDTTDTARLILDFERWVKKGDHMSLKKREPMVSPWGTKNNRDYQIHLVMGLPGVGWELADRILKKLGMPFGCRVTKLELMEVDGVGAKKADAILAALEAMEVAA